MPTDPKTIKLAKIQMRLHIESAEECDCVACEIAQALLSADSELTSTQYQLTQNEAAYMESDALVIAANGRLDAARESIKAAPHGRCASFNCRPTPCPCFKCKEGYPDLCFYGELPPTPPPCNCWKSRALAQLNAPKEGKIDGK